MLKIDEILHKHFDHYEKYNTQTAIYKISWKLFATAKTDDI